MNRRNFLKLAGLAGGGLVASASMAEAGFLADFLSWLKRRPAWSIPKDAGKYLTASDIRNAANALVSNTYVQGKNAHLGIIHPFAAYDLLADDFASLPLAHLRLDQLATVYYDKKAIENLKYNMTFDVACREIEASMKRIKSASGKIEIALHHAS